MRYIPPVGSADPDAPYVDESSGQEGSAVPANAIEFPQREIVNAIIGAGLAPDPNRVDQLWEAIQQAIALALSSGGGAGSSPVNDLLTILRSRNPIYPEVNTSDGSFNLTVVSAGNLQIPAGISVTHRGCFNDVTVLQNLTTLANKTYHLRKNWTTGWALKDLADTAYNPGGALAETDTAFDTTYDDMLTHRIVTNASNIATITPLKNKHSLQAHVVVQGTDLRLSGANGANALFQETLNWARMPRERSLSLGDIRINKTTTDRDFKIVSSASTGRNSADTLTLTEPFSFVVTRYGLNCCVMCDGAQSMSLVFNAGV